MIRSLVAALAVLVSSAPVPASAWERTLNCYEDPALGIPCPAGQSPVGLAWSSPCIGVHINFASFAEIASESTISGVVQRSAGVWNDVSDAWISVVEAGDTDEDRVGFSQGCGPGANANIIALIDEGWSHARAALALTTVTYFPDTGRIIDGDIELNGEFYAFAVVTTPILANGKNDLENTLTHEIGHLLGLDHTRSETFVGVGDERWTDATMFAETDGGEISKRTLLHDDAEGLRAAYPAATQPGASCEISSSTFVAPETAPGTPCEARRKGCAHAGPPNLVALAVLGLLAFRRRPWAIVAALALLPATSFAQRPWDVPEPPPINAVLVGHGELLDAAAVGDGYVTLGNGGLVVRWNADARVLAWGEVGEARALVVSSAAVYAVGPQSIEELDPHTLIARSSTSLIDWTSCGDDTAFAWTDSEVIRIDVDGLRVASQSELPFDAASCLVIGRQAWLVWYDGVEVHAIGDNLTTLGMVPWDLEIDPRFGSLGAAPAAIAQIPGQATLARALNEVTSPDSDAAPALSPCGLFEHDGRPSTCPGDHVFDARWMVTVPARPVFATLVAESLVLVEPFGFSVIRLLDGRPTLAQTQSPGAQVIAAVPGDNQVHLVTCEDTSAGAQLVAIDPLSQTVAAEALVTGPCADEAFSRGAQLSLAVGGSRVDYTVASGFLVSDSSRIEAASPPSGRSRIAFALVGDFMASCQEDAVTLVRTREDATADGEPIFGPVCARDARLVPVDVTADGSTGIGLLYRARGRYSAIVIAPDGSEIWRGALARGGESVTRLAFDGATAWVVDPTSNTTYDSSGEVAIDVLPATFDTTVRVWSDPHRIWVEAGDEIVGLRIERGALIAESRDGIWADDALLGRVIVRSEDGGLTVLDEVTRSIAPLESLLAQNAAAVDVDASSPEADGARLRPLQRLLPGDGRLLQRHQAPAPHEGSGDTVAPDSDSP